MRALCGMQFALLLVVLLLGGALGACRTDEDCNMAGRCANGLCKCEVGWKGTDCGELNMGVSYPCHEGGLCMEGEMGGVTTWGGWVVQAAGSYHMYAAMITANKTLSAWLTNGVVTHAVSRTPYGPYVAQDIALDKVSGAWDESLLNPAPVRAPDGQYLVYYMGTSPGTPGPNCSMPDPAVCMQRVGMAHAPTPTGPWTRLPPIVEPGEAGAWDDSFTTNPTPYVFSNGSVLLLYKARSRKEPSAMRTGVAFAETWRGPYRKLTPNTPIDVASNCEDAGIMYSEALRVFRVLFHCGCKYQYIWSRDGVSWSRTTPMQDWCNVTYPDTTSERLLRRERPAWIFADGVPKYLTHAVMSRNMSNHGGRGWTMVTELL